MQKAGQALELVPVEEVRVHGEKKPPTTTAAINNNKRSRNPARTKSANTTVAMISVVPRSG